MKYRDTADPTPGTGEALVDIQAVGVNFTDTYSRAGINPVPRLPWTIGIEAAGVVRTVGPDVSEVSEGDEVVFCSLPGCYADRVVAPSWRLIKRPAGLDAQAGAAAMLQGMTAHYLCYSTYPVLRGDRVLIHAGAGGTGLLLTQMVKHLGGYVFSTVSTEAKAELSRKGRCGSRNYIHTTGLRRRGQTGHRRSGGPGSLRLGGQDHLRSEHQLLGPPGLHGTVRPGQRRAAAHGSAHTGRRFSIPHSAGTGRLHRHQG